MLPRINAYITSSIISKIVDRNPPHAESDMILAKFSVPYANQKEVNFFHNMADVKQKEGIMLILFKINVTLISFYPMMLESRGYFSMV